jgi:DNA-binding winged helix-turn-helix (wHTH) protein
MPSSSDTPPKEILAYRFGPFEVNPHKRELRKQGILLRLERKPWQVLIVLLERPGELVTREEFEKRLWGDDVFVDFEHGLNSAVRKVRSVLCDSAEQPLYIGTVASEGYLFIHPVEHVAKQAALIAPNPESSVAFTATTPSPELVRPHLDRRTLWVWSGAAAFVAVIVLSLIVFRYSLPFGKRNLNFAARDFVLITKFENRTGESVFEGSLEYALEREFSNSQFLNVAPRGRIEDVLRLMKKPLDTKIDAALGREICLRDGGIRALLTGRIEKLGTIYVLSANVVDSASGDTVASLSEDVPGDSQMASAVRRLSIRVRENLGEKTAFISQSREQLEKATTPSMLALQFYSQALDLERRAQP